MRAALDVVLVVAGAAIVVSTMVSAVRSTILPRSAQNRLSRWSTIAVRLVFRLRARRSSSYQRRDRIMAMLGPAALLTMLIAWLVLVTAGYALVYFAVTGWSWKQSLELSGSSVVTLGATAGGSLAASVLSYSEAGIGLLVVALLITYLPSIYGAFSRREIGVSLLRVRAGTPPRATTMLIRYHDIDEAHYRLTELWRQWESWFVDVEETHTTFPVLGFFRSPQPEQSWVTAAGALLDAASFWVAAIEHPADPDAKLCIRAGFQALQRVAAVFDVPFDPDPQPGDPLNVSRSEWELAMDEMAAAGLPLLADRDGAWSDWAGWRVNYDALVLNLARLFEAPPAPWLSDRSPVAADHRSTLRRTLTTLPRPSSRARRPGR